MVMLSRDPVIVQSELGQPKGLGREKVKARISPGLYCSRPSKGLTNVRLRASGRARMLHMLGRFVGADVDEGRG